MSKRKARKPSIWAQLIEDVRFTTTEGEMSQKVHMAIGGLNAVPQLLGALADNARMAANHIDRISAIVVAAGAAAAEEAEVQYPGSKDFQWENEEGPLPDEPVDGNHFAVDDPNYPDRTPEDPSKKLYMKVTEDGGGSTVVFGPLSSVESYRIEHSQYGVHLQEDGYLINFLVMTPEEMGEYDADLFEMTTWEREERQYLDRLARDGEQGMGRLDLPTTGIQE